MVISYEKYETSLRRVSYISYEITTCVRFYLSCEIAADINIISKRKYIVDTDVVKYVTHTHTIFMT